MNKSAFLNDQQPSHIAAARWIAVVLLIPFLGCVAIIEPPAPSGEAAAAHKTESDPLSAGRSWISPTTGMKFTWIEALDMWVGKHEVTNAEYRTKNPDHHSGGYFQNWRGFRRARIYTLNNDRQPVVGITFRDAKTFAEWLTQRDRMALPSGYYYRLPTEQEWRTFAQCGDNRTYPWGDHWPPRSGQAGNYSDWTARYELNRTSIAGYEDGFPVSAPVDQLWENPWGLKGVGGNVWEACASDDSKNDFGAWRGASWISYFEEFIRCSARLVKCGSERSIDLGFRLVIDTP